MLKTDFLLTIVNDLGVFALLAFGYGLMLKRSVDPRVREAVIGLIFGVGACIAVFNSHEIMPGVRADVRATMLVLAAPFGGIIAAVFAALVTIALRIYEGGVGATAGVLNIAATALIGIAFSRCRNCARGEMSWKTSAVVGLACNVPLVFVLLIPVADPLQLFLHLIGPLTVGNVLGVMMLSRILTSATHDHLNRSELEAQATLDPLTGLLNRRGFERNVAPAFAQLAQSHGAATVVVIDIDYFKSVNDVFGHDTGDEILVAVANLIRNQIRRDDIIARFGGEEIVLVMPGIGEREAAAVAERLRRVIAQAKLLADRGHQNHDGLTVSIGLASRFPHETNFDEMFKLADEALYRAKRSGRNRVEVSLAAA